MCECAECVLCVLGSLLKVTYFMLQLNCSNKRPNIRSSHLRTTINLIQFDFMPFAVAHLLSHSLPLPLCRTDNDFHLFCLCFSYCCFKRMYQVSNDRSFIDYGSYTREKEKKKRMSERVAKTRQSSEQGRKMTFISILISLYVLASLIFLGRPLQFVGFAGFCG